MPADGDYSDDYVAERLKRDARATSSSTSNLGLGSLLAKRPTGAAPKPNTRFLKNLIRDTDTHNAALLAKEAEESRARLRRLREENKPKGKPERQFYSARSRHDGTSGPPAKRRRLSDELPERSEKNHGRHHLAEKIGKRVEDHRAHERNEKKPRRDNEEGYPDRSRQDHQDRRHHHIRQDDEDDRTKTRSRRHRSRSRSLESDDERDRTSRHKDGSDRRRRRRTRSPDRDGERDDQFHRNRRHRSRSRSRHRERRSHRSKHSSSPEPSHRGRSSQYQNETRLDEPSRHRHSPLSDSDPLEAIIGPPPPPAQPPIRSKGRGAFNRSTMDSHFADTYDPTADVTPDAEVLNDGDDWDSALEALRDRQKWRQQGAERLRAAGFTDAEVDKWANQKINAKGEREMDEADVKWGKMGEGREWDRGKVIDEDSGSVDVKPEWGRLKGT